MKCCCETVKDFCEKDYTPLEKGLLIAVSFLLGLVLGSVFSSRRRTVIGSYNGCENQLKKENDKK